MFKDFRHENPFPKLLGWNNFLRICYILGFQRVRETDAKQKWDVSECIEFS